jgi:V/A-type H+-transporting ATPase subunit E
LLRKAKETLEERRRSDLAKARLDFRMKLLEEKQNFLEETFHTAFEHIRNLNDKDHRKLVKKLAVEIAEPGEGTIVVARKDEKRVDSSLASDVNKALHEMGTPAKYKVSVEDIDIDGGFILKVGNVEIDCSFSSFFKQKREEMELEASAILFGT